MIESRPSETEWSTAQKAGNGNRSTFKPLIMSDASVYDLARHYYTLEEIATTFNVALNTVVANHSEAYNAGKLDAFQKPRILLSRVMQAFEMLELEQLTDPKTPVHNLLKAIELHARKHEGLDKDKSSKPEKPSASDIRFTPFDKDAQ